MGNKIYLLACPPYGRLTRYNWPRSLAFDAHSSQFNVSTLLNLPELLGVGCSLLVNFVECKASKFFSILFVISLWSFLSSAMGK
jgi:hypothetical protein